MKPMEFASRWILVTGASSGLGYEMARQLAGRHRANLVLVARRQSKLDELKAEIERTARVDVVTLTADLSRLADVDRIFEQATDGREIYGAILNAGVTHFGDHDELTWEDFQTMLATNVTSVVRLTRHFVPYLQSRGNGGGMMIVSSMAGITPVGYQSAYSGTKAFLVNYGCSLNHELEGKNVSLTTLVPGGIQTEMTSGERFGPLRGWLMPVDRCAADSLGAFRARRYLYAPGFTNRVSSVFAKVLPQRFLASRVAATYRQALTKART